MGHVLASEILVLVWLRRGRESLGAFLAWEVLLAQNTWVPLWLAHAGLRRRSVAAWRDA